MCGLVDLVGASKGIPWNNIYQDTGVAASILGLFGGAEFLRSRPRFGTNPILYYETNTVAVDVVKKGRAKDYISAVKVVMVKSRLYRFIRWIWFHEGGVSSVLIRSLPELVGEYTENQPATATVQLPPQFFLPPRWNPFRKTWSNRTLRRRELRLQVKVATKRKLRYMRLKRRAGAPTNRQFR
jgi:hypothetical protein